MPDTNFHVFMFSSSSICRFLVSMMFLFFGTSCLQLSHIKKRSVAPAAVANLSSNPALRLSEAAASLFD